MLRNGLQRKHRDPRNRKSRDQPNLVRENRDQRKDQPQQINGRRDNGRQFKQALCGNAVGFFKPIQLCHRKMTRRHGTAVGKQNAQHDQSCKFTDDLSVKQKYDHAQNGKEDVFFDESAKLRGASFFIFEV